MLFGKQSTIRRRIRMVHPIVFLPLFIAIIIVISNYTESKGNIVILENPNGKGFVADFSKWTTTNKCTLVLNKGDEVRVEVVRENGEIGLTITGKNGSEPYTGNNLESITFTVTVSETDEYDFRITGKKATGQITVRKKA